jgi:hypothetical protein
MNITRAKTTLKSYCYRNGYENPKYKIISKSGRGFRKFYTIRVDVNGSAVAKGEGISKRIARKKAALSGLNGLRILKHCFKKSHESDFQKSLNDSKPFIDTIVIEEKINDLKLKIDDLLENEIERSLTEEKVKSDKNENEVCAQNIDSENEELSSHVNLTLEEVIEKVDNFELNNDCQTDNQ